ncbi:hypothetical protein HGRIS_007274 [Hohenbuehelia grisea]|uniref:Tetratricopeptide repeat protein 39B n=1 Tax=Hohenbuehelia grisea TaxID=104357 RepID=A0ABR3JBJ3_9AGAR
MSSPLAQLPSSPALDGLGSPNPSIDSQTSTMASSPSYDDSNPTPATSVNSSPIISAETTKPTKTLAFSNPPAVKWPYRQDAALDDLPCMQHALELFLASHMVESEDYCHRSDEKKERLYFAMGYGLVQCVKGLMSYGDEDLLAGIAHAKRAVTVSSAHRKKAPALTSRLAGFVYSSLTSSGESSSTGIGFIKSMTPVERHAELVYAESLFEKALLGIVYSGDWLAFIKEALNMRTIIQIYRRLYDFIAAADAAYAETQQAKAEDPSIDAHFRSGVYLGMGISNLILSLMPGKLLTLVELFGYKGDRIFGLEVLMRAGGWSEGPEPSVGIDQEGVRRSICDMALLIFHLVLSSFTFAGIDVSVAQRILDWNLKRFPNGVFFLFGAGRLALMRSRPTEAVVYYTRAMEVQQQYLNLHHISFWEIAIAQLALWDVTSSLACWRELQKEATWSKAIYSYGTAVCLLELGGDGKHREEATEPMSRVSQLRQRIAGKSIPLEKFAARKARKFQAQGRLALPALELAYIFLAIAHAPRATITGKMLPTIQELLTKLHSCEADVTKYEGGAGEYWDDLCLAKFLEGVCLRYVAYPDPDAQLDPDEVVSIPKEQAVQGSISAFEVVFEHASKIDLDHYLVYYAHYELGRVLACNGDEEGAIKHFDLILSGKVLTNRKGKYSMENALHMRTHAALEALQHHRKRL